MNEPEKTVGLDGRLRRTQQLTPEEMLTRDQRILQMREEGATIRMISAELDCSRGTVHRIIKKGRSES